MRRDCRGSLTVEAVLILPVFMAAVLFISYFIKAHLVQDIVQDALNEAVLEVSSLSYPYYLSGASDFKNELDAEKARKMDALRNHFPELMDIVQSMNRSGASPLDGDMDRSSAEELTPEGLFAVGKLYAVSGAAEAVEDALVRKVLLNAIGSCLTSKDGDIISRMDALGIEGGLDGFDFSGSELYGNEGLLDVQIRYRLKKVDPFGFIDGVELKNRVVCRAWMGGIDHDLDGGVNRISIPPVKVGGDDRKDADQVCRTCYIILGSDTSCKYHLEDCPNLRVRGSPTSRKSVQPVQVVFQRQGDAWEPVGAVTFNGKTYEFCGNCKSGIIRMKH